MPVTGHPINTGVRHLARKDKTYAPLVVQRLAEVEAALGGRAALVGMLTLAPLTPDLEYVLGLLGDPQWQDRPLAEVCAQGNILPGELIAQLSAAALLLGKVQALQAVGAGIASVAADVVRRAAPYTEPCTDCSVDGVPTGRVTPDPTTAVPNPGPVMCPTCQGAKALRYLPELRRQELALDLASLLPKAGGLSITNTTVASASAGASGGAGSMLDKVQQLIDGTLYDAYGVPPPSAEEPVITVGALPPMPPADAEEE